MNQHISCVSQRNAPFLQCPVCNNSFEGHTAQLVCENNHIFDITPNNYIDFYDKSAGGHSHKNLFQTHSHLIENGFFQALESVIVKLLLNQYEEKETLTILDAGCGDGALFSNILLSLRWDKRKVNGFGIDIAKERVHYASRYDQQTSWLVGDLAQLPFKDHSVDIILNILSPAFYDEFKRVLKPDGILIKTIPGTDYLQELNLIAGKKSYSTANIVHLFDEQMHFYKQVHIADKKYLSDEDKAEVLQMVPVDSGSQLTVGSINQVGGIIIDLLVLVGQVNYE